MISSTLDLARFGGVARLYGMDGLQKLAAAHVAIIGVGGVGSWTAEALVRSGIGRLTLIDLDDVCVTNVNRQLPALDGQIGKSKVEVIAERMEKINPAVRCDQVLEFLTETNADRLLDGNFSFVIDAVDRMSIKALIVSKCVDRGTPVLTVGGAGGRRDLTQIEVGDLGITGGDLLLKQVRKKLRRDYGWEKGNNQLYGVAAVYSAEPQMFPWSNGEVCDTKEPESNLTMDCASGFGAACFLTGAFGFAAAGEVVRQLTTSA
ncbi:MAG TPA: tRNA threonylcarbamoyladenosine dehydratase [Chthoniobacterales bacterium]|jgi:tRNA A37 threonylcarbamoyladenosine dehydratase